MKSGRKSREATSLAAGLAPEDVRPGDYVAVLSEVHELPTYLWCDTPGFRPDEVVRVRCFGCDQGQPARVKSVCLPFVFVRFPDETFTTLDLRRVQIARVSRHYARAVWEAHRKARQRRQREL